MTTKAPRGVGSTYHYARRKLGGWSNGRSYTVKGWFIVRVEGVVTAWLGISKDSVLCTSELSERRYFTVVLWLSNVYSSY